MPSAPAISRIVGGQIPLQDRITVSVVVHRRRLGVADADNDLSRCKPLIDGLVDARVVKADTREHVTWGSVTEERGQPGVTLIIDGEA